DHHLAVGRTGDLDTPVEQVLRLRGDTPLALANGGGFREEVGAPAGVKLLLPRRAAREQLLAPRLELAMQLGDKSERRLRQDLRELARDTAGDRDVLRLGGGNRHRVLL